MVLFFNSGSIATLVLKLTAGGDRHVADSWHYLKQFFLGFLISRELNSDYRTWEKKMQPLYYLVAVSLT